MADLGTCLRGLHVVGLHVAQARYTNTSYARRENDSTRYSKANKPNRKRKDRLTPQERSGEDHKRHKTAVNIRQAARLKGPQSKQQ